ncbi:DUF3592 domain-containing protein [Streptomyces sp. VNUA116]|uniref:DUF3592 domain-containing protein n=1 Tax=Streptomyces sp. VNUA116 TaxID=3062449 RepID=UPI00349FD4D9
MTWPRTLWTTRTAFGWMEPCASPVAREAAQGTEGRRGCRRRAGPAPSCPRSDRSDRTPFSGRSSPGRAEAPAHGHASAARRSSAVTAIVRHVARRDDEGATYYHPLVAWTTRDGRTCEHSSRFGRGSVRGGFGVGTLVTVQYDPEDPSRFAIQG